MRARAGYVLPLTLASIIVVSIVVAIAAGQLRSASDRVFELQRESAVRLDALSAEQTMIYLLLTEPVTGEGLNVGGSGQSAFIGLPTGQVAEGELVPADGTPRRFGDMIVRLYDDQSFLNFRSFNQPTLARNLLAFGIEPAQAGNYIARLQDFQDEDTLRRIAGAEPSSYLPPGRPSDRPLLDVLELCSVQGWAQTPVCADRGRLLLTSRARTRDALSPRLVSEPVLQLMLGNPEQARQAFQAFQSRELSAFSAVGFPEFDIELDPLSTPGFPGPTFVVVTHAPQGAPAWRTTVRLTPGSVDSPFFIENKYGMGGEFVTEALNLGNASSLAALPEPSANSGSSRRRD